MEVKNCRDCGRLFNYIGGQRVCPNCRRKLEEKFEQVKKYIYDNKDATLTQVSEDTETSIQQIKQWIREERLSFTEDSVVGIECENCGTTIKTGRFCEKCKKDIASNLGSAYKKPPMPEPKKDTREKARMRFLDN